MIRVDWRVSCRLVGTAPKWLWVPLVLPLGITLVDGSALLPSAVPMVGAATLGIGLERLTERSDLRAREAFMRSDSHPTYVESDVVLERDSRRATGE